MLTERIQVLVDQKVQGSPRARELLAQLEGRRMRVAVRYLGKEIVAQSLAGKLRLLRDDHEAEDVRLSGSPLALLSLLREDATTVIRRGDVALTGDAEVGQRFQELAELLRPDLEAGLAEIIGDVPAFGLGSLVRKALGYGRAAAATQAANLGEYLTHERRLLVPRAEGKQFLEDVDALRESTDRLAARVASLEAREDT